jgi:DNA repair protein RadC
MITYKELVGEVELSYIRKTKNKCKINKTQDSADFFRKIWSEQIEFREEALLLLLNRSNNVLGWYKISSGGQAGTVVDPKLIFQAALLGHAAGIIVCHNHPSGNPEPSQEDMMMARKLKDAGKLLDINVLDFMIITESCHTSFADRGLI